MVQHTCTCIIPVINSYTISCISYSLNQCESLMTHVIYVPHLPHGSEIWEEGEHEHSCGHNDKGMERGGKARGEANGSKHGCIQRDRAGHPEKEEIYYHTHTHTYTLVHTHTYKHTHTLTNTQSHTRTTHTYTHSQLTKLLHCHNCRRPSVPTTYQSRKNTTPSLIFLLSNVGK